MFQAMNVFFLHSVRVGSFFFSDFLLTFEAPSIVGHKLEGYGALDPYTMKQNIRFSIVFRSHCKRHRACHPLLEEDNGCSFAMTVLDLAQLLFSHGKIVGRNRKLKAYAVWLREGGIASLSVSLCERTQTTFFVVFIASQRLGIQRLRELPMLVGSRSLKILSQLKIHGKHARCTALLESDL